jgi:alkaline phosphatase D
MLTPLRRAARPLAFVAATLALHAPAPLARAQASNLRSGPMLGYGEPREVLLWVQTGVPARVKVAYWDERAPERRYETAERVTLASEAHVAKLVADRVEPGHRYRYELFIDGERVERPYATTFRARLPRGAYGGGPVGLDDVRVALGSCFWVNDPADPSGFRPGADYGIFGAIAAQRPDLMLWLGDNVYLRDADASSRTGLLGRYTQTRALPELQPLLASTHHYAIWDDHDYGPNDSDRSYRDKQLSREAFVLFWGNPSFGIAGSPGITTRFTWGDVEFFLLDNRWNRSPARRATGRRQALGDVQLEWLFDALASSNATFKVVAIGNQVLNPHPVAETYATTPEERRALLEGIAAEGVRGVLFVTGDRHFTELSRLEVPGRYPLHDFTVSPLTTWVETNGAREPNALRVPGTHVAQRNFGTLEVTGPREDRRLTLAAWDVRGAQLWSRTLAARELRPPDP